MATTLDTYLPFDAGAGASVTEGQWRSMAERWLTDGVVAGVTNELAVSQRGAGANMSVDVATGEGRVRGHQGVSTSVKNLTIGANGSGNPRVDLVVLRADFTNNRIELDVVGGTAAAAPVEPALTQSASVWEIPLAAIAVASAAASIVTADLRDRRTLTRTVTQLAVKEPVRFATTAALAASTVVGVKRTANANGAFPATDGVTGVAGDRLLDKDHATGAQRGVWRLVELGSASRPWVLERPADFDESRDVTDGTYVTVQEGTLYGGSGWLQTANAPITLGTTSQTWTQFPLPQTPPASDTQKIGTNQSTTSTSFTDLATPGPAATVIVGSSGKLLVLLSAYAQPANSETAVMGFTLSGANTLAADTSLQNTMAVYSSSNIGAATRAVLLTGLTPGSTVITAKYLSAGGASCSWVWREVAGVAL